MLGLENLKNLCALRCILVLLYVFINFLKKKNPAQIPEIAGDLRRAPANFENPAMSRPNLF